MKKFLLIFAALFMLIFGANAQTTVAVNDSSMGYVEQYPVWDLVVSDTTMTIDSVISYDTTAVVYDSVDSVYNYTIDTVQYLDTNYTFTYDTVWIENYYDYRAFANENYRFDHWEIIIEFNTFYVDDSTEIDSVWFDNFVMYDCDSIDGEYVCNDGWLMLDGGVPDVDAIDSLNINSISIMAYFEADPLAINTVDEECFRVYPNPTTGVINIDGDFDYLRIYNANGREMYRGTYSCFDLQRLPKGTYFIVVVKNNVPKTIPVIKL